MADDKDKRHAQDTDLWNKSVVAAADVWLQEDESKDGCREQNVDQCGGHCVADRPEHAESCLQSINLLSLFQLSFKKATGICSSGEVVLDGAPNLLGLEYGRNEWKCLPPC